MKRRALIALGALAAPLAAPAILSRPARARTTLPDTGLTILVGYVAGGGTDLVVRAIATQLEQRLGRHVVIQNRPGASGEIPGEILKKGPPDGSTIAILASTSLVSKLATKDFPFDPLTDLSPITLAGTFPIGLGVSPKLDLRSFDEYIAWLKAGDAKRRRLGNTSSEAFIRVLNLLLDRSIGVSLDLADYRGAAPMVNDIAEGRIPAGAAAMTSMLVAHRGHRLRLLMTTGTKRLKVAPDVPTARELGYAKLEMEEWFAFFTAPGTPEPIVNEWNRQLGSAIQAVADEVAEIGLTAATSTPAEVTALVAGHQKTWEARMKEVGMTPVE